MIPWPKTWQPQYNGRSEPCDMLVGPCSCGATHLVTDLEDVVSLTVSAERERIAEYLEIITEQTGDFQYANAAQGIRRGEHRARGGK